MNQLPRARKRFGQNFLIDASIIGQIVTAIAPSNEDALVEIGPGTGALTDLLRQFGSRLTIVELDRDLVELLEQRYGDQPELTIINADALQVDFSTLYDDEKIRVVGNLPYNISTPLLFHLLKSRSCIRDMHFMLQKEVVQRLAAAPGSKDYGRLSVMVQYWCAVEPLIEVPPSAFRPAPKVTSAVVRLTPYAQPLHPASNENRFQELVARAFQQRRKTLRNTLKSLNLAFPAAEETFDLTQRPEQLSVADFVQLANFLDQENQAV